MGERGRNLVSLAFFPLCRAAAAVLYSVVNIPKADASGVWYFSDMPAILQVKINSSVVKHLYCVTMCSHA